MSLPSPRGVLFDFGNTLLREGPVDVAAGAAAILEFATETGGCTAEELGRAMIALMADLNPRRHSSLIELPLHSIATLLYDPLGIRFDAPAAEVEWVYWAAATMWAAEPGAKQVLDFLAHAGVPCGVVSNSMFRGQTIARQLASSGLEANIGFVMTSAEYVLRKPHRRIFRLAAQRLQIPADQLWFVGDSFEADVNGAAAAGMVPIWYCPDGPPGPRIDPAARVVRSWAELDELLRAALVVE